jgi:hypothetical protein
LSRFERLTVVLPMLLFPPAFYLTQAITGDWELWPWYYYPLVTAAPFSLSLALKVLSAKEVGHLHPLLKRLDLIGVDRLHFASSWSKAGCVAAAVALAGWYGYARQRPLPPSYEAGRAIQAFASTHPGRYAMGDRAGTVGYLISNPLLQLEGLVADRAFLQHILRRAALLNVLQKYSVRYYVASWPQPTDNGCMETLEPLKGGPRSPRMRGVFCHGPVFIHTSVDGTPTYVFDLAAER